MVKSKRKELHEGSLKINISSKDLSRGTDNKLLPSIVLLGLWGSFLAGIFFSVHFWSCMCAFQGSASAAQGTGRAGCALPHPPSTTTAPLCPASLHRVEKFRREPVEPSWAGQASLRWMGSIFLHGSVRAMPLRDFTYLQPHRLLCLLQCVPEMPPEVFCDDPNQSVFRNGGLLKIQQEFVLHILLCISGADLVCSCSANSFFPIYFLT